MQDSQGCWGPHPIQLREIWKPSGLLCPLSWWRLDKGRQHAGRSPGAALPARVVELAPLQWDLGHVLPQTHEQDALAVEDLQASDGLRPPLGEELHLFQQTAARGLSQGCPHFFNGAVICGGDRERRKWGQRVAPATRQLSHRGSPAWLHIGSSADARALPWTCSVSPAVRGTRRQYFPSSQQREHTAKDENHSATSCLVPMQV